MGFKFNESGSSIDLLRIQFLARSASTDKNNSKYEIFELKETRCPGVETFLQQKYSLEEKYKKININLVMSIICRILEYYKQLNSKL